MSERPAIADCADLQTFRNWYYLKTELVDFARANGLRTSGSKFDIADRIAHFIEFGTAPVERPKAKVTSSFNWATAELTDDTVITDSYRNNRNVRSYFSARVDGFAFSTPLMDWMKDNAGKTLADAVVVAQKVSDDKRRGVKQPDQPHNQYNAYMRAYFAAVPDGSQSEVRELWAERRKHPGPYVFALADLALVRPIGKNEAGGVS